MNNSINKIEKKIWNTVNTETRIGALDGLSGIALFYSYLTKIIDNDEYNTKLMLANQVPNYYSAIKIDSETASEAHYQTLEQLYIPEEDPYFGSQL